LFLGFVVLVFRHDTRVAAFLGGLVFGYGLNVWGKMEFRDSFLREYVSEETERKVDEKVDKEVVEEKVEEIVDERVDEGEDG